MSLSGKTTRWLQKNCRISLEGKTVLVTGANSGIGFKTAEIAVYLGARVILACRNEERAAKAASGLLRDHPGAEVQCMKLDLASLASVKDFAETLRAKGTDIDVFVNNAGVFRHPGEKTADGFDLVLGTNYLGVYALKEKVLPYLASLGHDVVLVNTISLVHRYARTPDYSDFWCEKHYSDLRVYAQSKLCVARYTWALANKNVSGNVRIYMTHPGIALTPLGLGAFGKWVTQLSKVFGGLFNSPEKSATPLAWLLSNDLPQGSIVGPTKLFGGWGYPRNNRISRKVQTGAEELICFTEKTLREAGETH